MNYFVHLKKYARFLEMYKLIERGGSISKNKNFVFNLTWKKWI